MQTQPTEAPSASESSSQRVDTKASTGKRAWPGQQVVRGDMAASYASLLRRKLAAGSALTSALLTGLFEHEVPVPLLVELPDGWQRDATGLLIPPLLQCGTDSSSDEPAAEPPSRKRSVTFAEPRLMGRQSHIAPAELFATPQDKASAQASRLADEPSVKAVCKAPQSAQEAYEQAVAFAAHVQSEAASAAHSVAAEAAQSFALHVGSSRPHATDGDQPCYQRADRWAHAGSLRHLDVESDAVLATEPLPRCNVPTRTGPEDPPPRRDNPPGPFTTAQLIPHEAVRRVKKHGAAIVSLLKRAQRGAKGPKVARGLRPEALILEEHEALNRCGRGWTWRRRADCDLWDAVQPSDREHPPDSTFKGDVFEQDATRLGMVDKQLVSWGINGFPGARAMPAGTVVIGYPHAGAIRHAADLEAMNQRDLENGFVSSGWEFPEFWPCVCDPMNIVIQHGKPRATIDKTIRLSSRSHPQPVPSYNDHIDLEDERQQVPFKLVRVWQLSRATAILQTAGVTVKLGKFDLSTYFRIHGKQMAHVWQSGRILETLFGFDFRVNFGERDAPDHTGRASDALAFFVRTELRRLGAEYPTRCPLIVKWLAMRLGLAREASEEDDPEFVWTCLFFFLYYVDDAGLACFCDQLYDKSGRAVISLHYDDNGNLVRRIQTREVLYFDAAMGVVQRYGHLTPVKKQSRMGYKLDFLGILLDAILRKRLLTNIKREAYLADLQAVLRSPKNPNGTLSVAYDAFNSLLHKLLHASEVVPIGRAHMFHMRAALRAAKPHVDSDAWHAVYLGSDAQRELSWWESQLSNVACCEAHGVPFAVRFGFPVSSDDTIVHYGDASRELDDLPGSGFGAWAVIRAQPVKPVFVYIEGRWTPQEVAHYSINVLECAVKDWAASCFIRYARSCGLAATHSLAFTDNSTAEATAEFGRTIKPGLFALNKRRQEWLIQEGVHQSTERVTSVDNDVADLLSRGSITEALRYPTECGLPVLRLELLPSERDLSHVPYTWA